MNKWSDMNSPWYAALIAQVAVLIYLCFFCGDLPRGLRKFHRENLLLLKCGRLTPSLVGDFESSAGQIISEKQRETLHQQMIEPMLEALTDGIHPHCSFTVLERDDGRLAAILHYESKKDLLEDLPELPEDEDEDEKEEVPADTCIRSEFLGMRRLMIIHSREETHPDKGNA